MATAMKSAIMQRNTSGKRLAGAATEEPQKDTVTELKLQIKELAEKNETLETKIKTMEATKWCYMCDRHQPISHFYVTSDPMVKGKYAPICRKCAKEIALRIDEEGFEHEPTKESVKTALRYLNKPFLDDVWTASIGECMNKSLGKTKSNVWASYIKNIQMVNYNGMTWEDSDMFKKHILYDDEKTEKQIVEEHSGQDTYDSFQKNKLDVIRLLDYDPFEEEPTKDQPFLYAQLLGMLDASEEANEDMMRVSAAIQIVRAFLQMSKIDDTIAKLMGDVRSLANNSATIKSLQDSKQKLTSMITNQAAENCLSLKNSKSNTKGENTFTGKLKRIRSYNLREADLNGYSVGCCKGMKQVADISMSAIIDKLAMDDSEWADIVKNQRIMLDSANKKADNIEEAFRILLRENLDMRKTMENANLIKTDELIDLEDLLGTYVTGTIEKEQEEEVQEDEPDTTV